MYYWKGLRGNLRSYMLAVSVTLLASEIPIVSLDKGAPGIATESPPRLPSNSFLNRTRWDFELLCDLKNSLIIARRISEKNAYSYRRVQDVRTHSQSKRLSIWNSTNSCTLTFNFDVITPSFCYNLCSIAHAFTIIHFGDINISACYF